MNQIQQSQQYTKKLRIFLTSKVTYFIIFCVEENRKRGGQEEFYCQVGWNKF